MLCSVVSGLRALFQPLLQVSDLSLGLLIAAEKLQLKILIFISYIILQFGYLLLQRNIEIDFLL
jgi:hypothetical protein